ncbi:MAG: hypothetical protein ACLRSW_09680 [Christensenellaceae bacterium]
MKNKLSKILVASLSGAMVYPTQPAKRQGRGKAVSYVGIDVNPSVSLVLDKNDKVLSVLADNEDAQVFSRGKPRRHERGRSREKNRGAFRRARVSEREQPRRKHYGGG